MHYILDRGQIRDLEKFTIENQNISEKDLMVRASKAFTKEIIKAVDYQTPILVIVGSGNNGGDGITIAQYLLQNHYKVSIFIESSNRNSYEFQSIFNQISRKYGLKQFIQAPEELKEKLTNSSLVVIDALFGIGLNRELSGASKRIVELMNQSKCPVYSVDVPSGMNIDEMTPNTTIVKSTFTFTFDSLKLNFLIEGFQNFVPKFKVLDIQLSTSDWHPKEAITHFSITSSKIKTLFQEKRKFTYKYQNGHMLLIGGSYGKIGAAILAGLGALKSGVGLLTCHMPRIGFDSAQSVLVGALFELSRNPNFISYRKNPKKYNSIVFGCGVGINEHTRNSFYFLVQHMTTPLVIDADGLNLIAKSKKMLTYLSSGSILTPHNKEFERIVGRWKNEEEKFEKLKLLSSYTKSIVILKGAHTCVAEPNGKLHFNLSGNNGMAKAGMGDVLAGMVGSFLAQGYSPLEASLMSVYLHGLAGDLCEKKIGKDGYTVDDLANAIPLAIQDIQD